MELLLGFDFCEELAEEGAATLSKEERERVIREAEMEEVEAVELVNIGPGADFYVVLLLLSVGLQAIKLGAEIHNGIEGWVALGKKIKRLFDRKRVVAIDMEGATALAIAYLAAKVEIEKLERIHESTINLVDLSGMLPTNRGLSKAPHNYYIQSYRVNDMETFVIGITSNGKVELIKRFAYSPYGVMEAE